MAGDVEDRLEALGIVLPTPAAPAANYIPAVEAGGLLYVSGQLPTGPEGIFAGKLGRDFHIPAGQAAARLAAINVLAQAKAALGRLDRIRRLVRVTGFINGTADFTEPHQVLNGASDFFVEALGDAGRHTRSVMVAVSLPMDAAVLVDAIFEVA